MRIQHLFASSLLLFAACGDDAQTVKVAPRAQAPVVEPAPIAKPAPSPSIATSTVVTPAPEPIVDPVIFPDDYTGLMKEGSARRAAREFDIALQMFEKASQLKSKAAKPHTEMARVYLDTDDIAKAREHAQLSIEKYESSSAAWNTMGRVELAERDLDAAVASFERATEENEDNSYAWNNLGLTLIQQGNYADAADALERATSGDTVTAYMWNNLGMAYEHLDRVVEARAAYEQASDKGSTIAASHFERLDGVTSIARAMPSDDSEDDSADTTDVALDTDPSIEIE